MSLNGRDNPFPLSLGLLLWGVWLSGSGVYAQDGPALLARVVLPAEVKQAASRLAAADRLADRTPEPELVTLLVGSLGPGGVPGGMGAAVALGLERTSQEKWTEALEEYQRLIYESGDALVPVPPRPLETTVHSLPLRQLCHRRLAALPPALLRQYRQRVDQQAQQWLEEGKRNRDGRLLRRLVAELFCSRCTDQALELLGDWAFEKGNFAEALAWWRLVVPPASLARQTASLRQQTLLFPDPTVEVARLRAKQILAHLFAGDVETVARELPAFQDHHADARGYLGGREGVLVDMLRAIKQDWEKSPFWEDDEPWTTFAGNAARNRVFSQCPSARLWADGPTWRVPLGANGHQDKPGATRRPLSHPLIVGDRVLHAQGHTIKGHHLLTGAEVFRYDFPAAGPGGQPKGEPTEDSRFTLTAHQGRLYARFGKLRLNGGRQPDRFDDAFSYLVCLDIHPRAGAKEGRELWKIQAPQGVVFEGTPLAHEGRLYLAASRASGERTKTAISCYDAETGAVRWQHDLCDTPEADGKTAPRTRQHLLTLAGGLVVYASHSGVIGAVDAANGQPAWAVRYPGRGRRTTEEESAARNLCPCVYSAGRIFAAPGDSNRLFCLEAATGDLAWEREGMEVTQLLGVAKGHVLFTTPRGIQAVSAATGVGGGWLQPAEGRQGSLGRGLLLGGWVFWPTSDPHLPLRALRQEDGNQENVTAENGPSYFEPTQLRHLRAGNMAFAKGCLVVVTGDELVAYVAPRRFLPERQDNARPLLEASAWALYELAQAEADADHLTAALDHFDQALRRADDPWMRRRIVGPFHDLLLESGQFARAARDLFPPRRRVEALRRQAMASQPEQALTSWQNILLDDHLSAVLLPQGQGRWQRAGQVATAAVAEVLRNNSSYRARYDQQAAELLATATGEDKTRILRRVLNGFPNTRATAQAQLELALLMKPLGRKPLLGGIGSPPLWRTWEAPCPWGLAVEQASGSSADLFLGADGATVRCLETATGQVRWERQLTGTPMWAGQDDGTLFVGGPTGIHALAAMDGHTVWQLDIDATFLEPLGSFHLTRDSLFCLANERLLLSLSPQTGRVHWSTWGASNAGPLMEGGRFQPQLLAMKDHVVVQIANREGMTIDSRTGQVVQRFATANMPWQQSFLFGDEHLLMAEAGKAVRFNPITGKTLWSYQPPWPTSLTGEPLQLVASSAVLVVIPRNHGYDLVRLDPKNGTSLWGDGVHVSREPLRAEQIALRQDTVLLATDQQLHCRAVKDGQLRWAVPLPPGSWRVWVDQEIVLVNFQDKKDLQGWLTPLPNFPFVFPQMRPTPPREDNGWLIQLHDPTDGRLLQRLHFPAAWPGTTPVLQRSAGGLVVASGGRAWGVRGQE